MRKNTPRSEMVLTPKNTPIAGVVASEDRPTWLFFGSREVRGERDEDQEDTDAEHDGQAGLLK